MKKLAFLVMTVSLATWQITTLCAMDDDDPNTTRKRNKLPALIAGNQITLQEFSNKYRNYFAPQSIEDAVRLLSAEGVRGVWTQEAFAELSDSSDDEVKPKPTTTKSKTTKSKGTDVKAEGKSKPKTAKPKAAKTKKTPVKAESVDFLPDADSSSDSHSLSDADDVNNPHAEYYNVEDFNTDPDEEDEDKLD